MMIHNPSLYIAVTHSGITLAPLLSYLIAIEILYNVELDLLEPYRPPRFLRDKTKEALAEK
jgi:glycine/D-amino acid oxidase-like deaminating enzyme